MGLNPLISKAVLIYPTPIISWQKTSNKREKR